MWLSFGASVDQSIDEAFEDIDENGQDHPVSQSDKSPRGTPVYTRSTQLMRSSRYRQLSETVEVKRICGWRRSSYRFLFFIILFVAYMSLCAVAFNWIEMGVVRGRIKTFRGIRRQFLEKHLCVSDAELEKFIDAAVKAAVEGVPPMNNGTTAEDNWNYGQAMLFVTAVVTTIGYGNTTPLTQLGKFFCVIFAMGGIPLVMILFNAGVERLMIPASHIFDWMRTKMENVLSLLHIRLIHLSLVFFLLCSLFFCLPAVAFCLIEKGWTYMDAIYYCFVSLTTIGLGDYVPAENVRRDHTIVYKLATCVYLYMGITFFMFFLRIYAEVPQLNAGFYFVSLASDEMDQTSPPPDTSFKPYSSAAEVASEFMGNRRRGSINTSQSIYRDIEEPANDIHTASVVWHQSDIHTPERYVADENQSNHTDVYDTKETLHLLSNNHSPTYGLPDNYGGTSCPPDSAVYLNTLPKSS